MHGVRYELKRPVHQLAVRLPPGEFEFVPLSQYETLHLSGAGLFGEVTAYPKASTAAPPGKGEVECRRGAAASQQCRVAFESVCTTETVTVDVVFEQTLEGRSIYEIQGAPWWRWPLHSFSDTEIGVVLDDDGRLASVTAGETDKALEFVQAVAGLALKAAAADEPEGDQPLVCQMLPVAAHFDVYQKKHEATRKKIARLSQWAERARSALDNGDPLQQKAALETLNAVDTQLIDVRKVEAGLAHPLAVEAYRLSIREWDEGTTECGSSAASDPKRKVWILNEGLDPVDLQVTLCPSSVAPLAIQVEEVPK